MMLEMSESCDTCRGKLLTRSGTSQRERIVLQSTKLKGVDIRHGVGEFGICPAGFKPCFIPVFPHYDVMVW